MAAIVLYCLPQQERRNIPWFFKNKKSKGWKVFKLGSLQACGGCEETQPMHKFEKDFLDNFSGIAKDAKQPRRNLPSREDRNHVALGLSQVSE